MVWSRMRLHLLITLTCLVASRCHGYEHSTQTSPSSSSLSSPRTSFSAAAAAAVDGRPLGQHQVLLDGARGGFAFKERRGIQTSRFAATRSSEVPQGSSISTSVFNLAKTILGAGIFSLPAGVAAFSDRRTALMPACVALVIMGLLSAYSFSSIGRACATSDSTSFSEAWQKIVSPSTSKGIASIITFKTFLGCLMYSMILGEP